MGLPSWVQHSTCRSSVPQGHREQGQIKLLMHRQCPRELFLGMLGSPGDLRWVPPSPGGWQLPGELGASSPSPKFLQSWAARRGMQQALSTEYWQVPAVRGTDQSCQPSSTRQRPACQKPAKPQGLRICPALLLCKEAIRAIKLSTTLHMGSTSRQTHSKEEFFFFFPSAEDSKSPSFPLSTSALSWHCYLCKPGRSRYWLLSQQLRRCGSLRYASRDRGRRQLAREHSGDVSPT